MSIPSVTRQYELTQVGSYHNFQLVDAPVPKPKATEVLVKTHAVSLQFRDLLIAKGTYSYDPIPNLVPGSDVAGVIVAVGDDVKEWKEGDRVCVNFTPDHLYGDADAKIHATSLGAVTQGVLTEYRTFPAYSLVRIPDHLSFEEASTLPCAALTAYNALNGPVKVKAGDTVLILGTGGVSLFGLQLAVATGATVILTSSSDQKLEFGKKLGATHLINYKTHPDWHLKVLEITGGRGVDHILEVGGGTLLQSIKSIRWGGQIAVIGIVSQEQFEANLVVEVIKKGITLRGILIGSLAQFRDMLRLIEAHPETTRPVVGKVFSFEETKEAYAFFEAQQHVGKVVIRVASN